MAPGHLDPSLHPRTFVPSGGPASSIGSAIGSAPDEGILAIRRGPLGGLPRPWPHARERHSLSGAAWSGRSARDSALSWGIVRIAPPGDSPAPFRGGAARGLPAAQSAGSRAGPTLLRPAPARGALRPTAAQRRAGRRGRATGTTTVRETKGSSALL